MTVPTDLFLRIWHHDPLAITVTIASILLQVLSFVLLRRYTHIPLKAAGKEILALATALSKSPETVLTSHEWSPKLRYAWKLAIEPRQNGGEKRESLDIDVAFSPQRLLPGAYNQRLDSAAPGLFTACGIAGTFVGLIIAFVRVDPSQASNSISHLIGGTSVAFFNSLCGVLLSVIWTVRSRWVRHRFDVACEDLSAQLQSLYPKPDVETALFRQLETLTRSVDGLHSATEQSSKNLLAEIAPRLEQAFRALVNAPFDNLARTVSDFESIVRDAHDAYARSADVMATAADAVARGTASFGEIVAHATDCVATFDTAREKLGEATERLSAVVETLITATAGLNEAAREVRMATDRYDTVTRSLAATNQTLFDTNATMREAVDRLASATQGLIDSIEAAGSTVREIVSESLEPIHGELGDRIADLVRGLEAVGARTVQAYEEAANQVVQAVDESMSDLTDRLSAELTTLANRLPEEVASLNQAMATIRGYIVRVTRELESATQQLAVQTRESLTARLKEYDAALAAAMDHFSGTLERWDGKVTEIAGAASEFRRVAEMANQWLSTVQRSAE